MQASLWWQPAQHIRMRVGLCQHQAFELPAEQRGQEIAMRQLIAGNWKMHMLRAPATELAREVRAGAQGLACDLLVCPPFTAIETVASALAGSDVAVGGQDCHPKGQGAHTGDVSAAMLRDAGASWVIVGHSERRRDAGETDELIGRKLARAIDAGLRPILCVGERLEEREAGEQEAVVDRQLRGALRDLGPELLRAARLVIAYEPVWAIGTGRNASGRDAATMAGAIRSVLTGLGWDRGADDVPVLYGGSVTSANIAEFLAEPSIDGALVGGASLKPDEMAGIVARAGLTAAARRQAG
jgi:triosephosphate isomerase